MKRNNFLRLLTALLLFTTFSFADSDNRSLWTKTKEYDGGENRGYYVYFSVGGVSTDETEFEKGFIDYYNPQEKDEKSSAFKIALGRKISNYFSIEAQFTGLGTSKYKYNESGSYSWTDWDTLYR